MNKLHVTALILAIVLLLLFMVRCSVKNSIERNSGVGESTHSRTEATETLNSDLTFPPWTKNADTEAPDADPYTEALFLINDSIKSGTVFVYDLDRANYSLQKGASKVIYPSEITMLWTGLYALSVMPEYTVIKPIKSDIELAKKSARTAYVREGHALTLSMLIEGMMVDGGSDCAYAIATAVGRYIAKDDKLESSAAMRKFMVGLNAYMETIKCPGSRFETPDGFSGESHYTTVHDLVEVSKLCLENEIISSYTKISSAKVYYVSKHSNTWKSDNKFLDPESSYYCENVTGLKLSSYDGNYSALLSLEIDGANRFIIGVMNSASSENCFDDALRIVNALNGVK